MSAFEEWYLKTATRQRQLGSYEDDYKKCWNAALTYRPDCLTRKNRGKVYELSQEMYCEHCKWDGPAEDHYESV